MHSPKYNSSKEQEITTIWVQAVWTYTWDARSQQLPSGHNHWQPDEGQTHPEHNQQGQQSSRLHLMEPPRRHSPGESGYVHSHHWSMHQQCGIPLARAISNSLSQYSAEPPDTYTMTTTAEHQDLSLRWWKTSTENRSQRKTNRLSML